MATNSNNTPTGHIRKQPISAFDKMALPRSLFIIAIALSGQWLPAKTYYVSSTGKDSDSGSSSSQAFRTVGKINGIALKPGDSVFFEGGSTFTDAGLYLSTGDSGSSSSPVTIGSYGTGQAILAPSAATPAVSIQNVAGIIIRDLILQGKGLTASTASGVNAYCGLNGGVKLDRLEFQNLDISGFRYGINVGAYTYPTSYSGFKNLLIANCFVHDCRRNGIVTNGDYPSLPGQKSHENVTIQDCRITGVTGDPLQREGHSGSGIILGAVKGGLIERCVAWNNGGMAGNYRQPNDPAGLNYGGGPCGIWTWSSELVTIRHCLVYGEKTNNGIPDGDGFDLDGGTTYSTIEYCYSYNNDGTGYLIYTFDGAAPTTNNILRYNVSWGDARTHMASGFHISRGSGTDSVVGNIDIYNNLVYANGPNTTPCIGVYGSLPMNGLRVRNNIFVVNNKNSFVTVDTNAGRDFITFAGNLYYAVDGYYSKGWQWGTSGSKTSLTAWRGAYGGPEIWAQQQVGLQADPKIAALTTVTHPTTIAELLAFQGFRLGAGSPAIDAGLDLRRPEFGSMTMPATDFCGNPVPNGGAYDLGPFESPYPLQAPSLTIDQSEAAPDQVSLSFTPLRSDLSYQIESSSDLKLWTVLQTTDPAAIQLV